MEYLISPEQMSDQSLVESKILTPLQFAILKKRVKKEELTSNEKTYYYKFIKPKIQAMMAFFDIGDIVIQGRAAMIGKRADEAITIIRKLERKHKNKRMLISGSFLFSNKYKDIDVFIITTYHKEDYRAGKLHVSFLQESALDSLFFHSISQISVSNFRHAPHKQPAVQIDDLLQTYELLIESLLKEEDDKRLLREFILQTAYISTGTILDPAHLSEMTGRLHRKTIGIISHMLINALTVSGQSVKKKVQQQLKAYKELARTYATAKNLPHYIETYGKVIELACQ